MRNLLAFAAACVLGFLVVGWYLDWYRFTPASSDMGHRSYTIDIDSKKIGTDVAHYVHEGEEKLSGAVEAAEAAKKNATTPAATKP
jgi:hypothetical protein